MNTLVLLALLHLQACGKDIKISRGIQEIVKKAFLNWKIKSNLVFKYLSMAKSCLYISIRLLLRDGESNCGKEWSGNNYHSDSVEMRSKSPENTTLTFYICVMNSHNFCVMDSHEPCNKQLQVCKSVFNINSMGWGFLNHLLSRNTY